MVVLRWVFRVCEIGFMGWRGNGGGGGQICGFGRCGFMVVRFIGWLYFLFLLLWFVVVANGATMEVVVATMLVFMVAVACFGCLCVVVDGGSGLWLTVVVVVGC